MTLMTDDAVVLTVVVETTPRRAFDVFTKGFATWWPLDTHHIGEQDAVDAVLEPRVGGRWFERAADGTECDWGSVLVWEPPTRLVLAWQLNPDFAYDPDTTLATEVEVRFVADGAATRVELEHRGFSVHGERGDAMRTAVGSEGGWKGLLTRFAAAAA